MFGVLIWGLTSKRTPSMESYFIFSHKVWREFLNKYRRPWFWCLTQKLRSLENSCLWCLTLISIENAVASAYWILCFTTEILCFLTFSLVKLCIWGLNLFNAFIFIVIRNQSQTVQYTVDTLRKEMIPAQQITDNNYTYKHIKKACLSIVMHYWHNSEGCWVSTAPVEISWSC